MDIEKELEERSGSKCELCGGTDDLGLYAVPPTVGVDTAQCVYLCSICRDQIDHPDKVDANHWRCLNDSMWSQVPAVQVMVWRMLNRLLAEGWTQDLLDQLYLDDDVQAWAEVTGEGRADSEAVKHFDCNGTALVDGDTVTLVKDLKVKGANFTAKRGVAVRGISLVADNPEQIEGRVNGQQIVILTKFVKKSG